MGTRNLTCVVLGGKFRVAQYCQWDGYPRGVGQEIVTFLQKEYNPARFRAQVDKVRELTADEVKARWKEAGADESGWVTMDISQRVAEKHPHLTREYGPKILAYIQNIPEPEVSSNVEFAKDSLFCEWAYVLDLDKNTFEVYKGLCETPLSENERFYFLQNKNGMSTDGYYPVRLQKTFPLSDVTTQAWESFIEGLNPKDL